MIQAHPQSDELTAKLTKLLRFSTAWSGTVYRFVTVPYSNRRDLLSGAGSRLHGARWNPPGKFNVLYGSFSPQTAVAEALGTATNFGIPPAKSRPRVFAAITFRLQAILDLTLPNVAKSLDVDFNELLRTNWMAIQDDGREALSQAIGRVAWELKLEGIVVSSAAVVGEKNLAVFPSRRLRGSSWKIPGARDLPKK